MKLRILMPVFLGCALSVFGLDAGGVSIDFAHKRKVDSAAVGQTFIPGGHLENEGDLKRWKHRHWVHLSRDWNRQDAYMKASAPLVSLSWKQEAGCLNNEAGLLELKDSKQATLSVSNRMETSFAFTGAGDHVFRFRCHGHQQADSGYLLRASLIFQDKAGKALGGDHARVYVPSQEAMVRSLTVTAPPQTARVTVAFALYGVGQAYIREVSLTPVQEKSVPVTARLMPFHFLDNLFYLPESTPHPIQFGLRRHVQACQGQHVFHLELPKGFTVLASRRGNPLTGLGEGHWTVTVTDMVSSLPRDSYSVTGHVVNLLIIGTLPSGTKTHVARYWTESDGVTSPVETFGLRMLPLVSGRQPKRFKSGFCPMNDITYAGRDGVLLYPLLESSGFNGALYFPLSGIRELFEEQGKTFEIYAENMANGYRIGPQPIAKDALFRGVDGKPFRYGGADNICPTEVYRQGRYYREKVRPEFEGLIRRGIYQFMANWEPYMFDDKGCFCERCRDEFIAYSKMDRALVTSQWGKGILTHHHDVWEKFRSWQHGQLVQTLERTIAELGRAYGHDAHFIPMISYTCLLKPNQHRQYDPLDYLDKLSWFEPWGPYLYHDFTEPYQYFCGWNVITYCAAEEMQSFLRRKIPQAEKRPRMIAFPHAYQCGDWVTEPESLAFEFLCFFVQRFGGSFAYLYPLGYDYRYWRVLAKTNTVIAALEDLVLDGVDISSEVTCSAVTPLPASNLPPAMLSCSEYSFIGGVREAGLLQFKAYRRGEDRLVAVGNFWQKGACFFRVAVRGLVADQMYQVEDFQSGVDYGCFSGRQLQQGILAQVGGLRWNMLVIRPGSAPLGTDSLSQGEVEKAMALALPGLKVRQQAEMRQASARFVAKNDYGKLPPQQSYGVTLKAVKRDGQDYLQVTSGSYGLLLDVEHGGQVVEWTCGADSLVGELGSPAGLGGDSFLAPKVRLLSEAWQLLQAVVDIEGIRVVLAYRIPEAGEPTYGGLNLIKEFYFKPDALHVRVTVRNDGREAREFSYRSFQIPAYLSTRDGKQGVMAMGNWSSVRPYRNLILKVGTLNQEARKPYYSAKEKDLSYAPVLWTAPWAKTKVTATFSEDGLSFYALWDTASQRYSTFEVLYEACRLKPREEKTYQATWKLD